MPRIERSWSQLMGGMGALWRGGTARNESDQQIGAMRGEKKPAIARDADASAGQESPGKPIERILIYRLGSLGDTIVALPCLHKIAAVFPNAERTVLTNIPVSSKAAPLEAILANSGLIHGVVAYPVGLRSVRRLWALGRRLRKLEISTLVYLTDSRGFGTVYRDLVFFRLCGIKRIIGAHRTRDLPEAPALGAAGSVERECVRLIGAIAELGPVDLDSRSSWDLRLTEQERDVGGKAVASFQGRPFIAINMGGKAVENHWGNGNWRRLFDELASTHGDHGLLVIGAAEDALSVAEVTGQWPSPVINACGRLAPRESAAALEKASLFVGHDSGPMHLAAACGIDCVALFSGRNRPRKWHPYGPRHKVIHRMEGIDAIKVGEVAAAVREALPTRAFVKIKS